MDLAITIKLMINRTVEKQEWLLMAEPLAKCIEEAFKQRPYDEVIYLTPDGEVFNQGMANTHSNAESILLICGHYKGIDQRIRDKYVTREISIGDYVVTGGELGAAILVDSITRLIPGVINDERSALSDSFQDGLLAPPVYTRPADFEGERSQTYYFLEILLPSMPGKSIRHCSEQNQGVQTYFSMALNMVEDMMGRTVHLPEKVNRIVSLVPSQTELLYDLGIMPVGQTLFCVHPKEHFKNAVKIGGTKKLNIEKIKGLKPDLIVGNKEENDKDQIEELSAFFPVWMSDIYTLEDALVMIRELGSMLQVNEAAMDMVTRIKSGFDALAKQAANHQTVAYLIWKNPYMAAGRQTFIQSMLDMLGCQNVFKRLCLSVSGTYGISVEKLGSKSGASEL
jgi:ABC-type Fe3+-citrate transport system substrate-binding protein